MRFSRGGGVMFESMLHFQKYITSLFVMEITINS